jgi:hypothetical protein
MAIEVETVPAGFIPEDKYKDFRDVRCWLAQLYKYALQDRKHLKTKKGLAVVDAEHFAVPAQQYTQEVQSVTTALIVLVLQFNEMKWRDIDLSTTPPPKIPDYLLLGLIKHSLFCNEDIDTVIKDGFKLRTPEKKVLKEFALRMCE